MQRTPPHAATTLKQARHAGLTDDEAQLSDRVRSLVGPRGITHLARTLELNHESVRRYVRGATSPPALFLLRIAKNQDVDCRWLLTGQSDQDEQALRTASTQALVGELDRRLGVVRDAATALQGPRGATARPGLTAAR